MAIDTPEGEYTEFAPTWAQARALSGGVAAVRELVWTLPHMDEKRAEQYRQRAYYMPAFPRTVEFLQGLVFLRAPIFEAPAAQVEALKPFRRDATGAGLDLEGLASQIVSEVLRVGRVAALVDFPAAPEGLTVAQAEALGLRARVNLYHTENILGAVYGQIGGVRRLLEVRLWESRVERDAEYNETIVQMVRVCTLSEGIYRQFVWARLPRGWVLESEVVPLRNGQPLRYIPITFFRAQDNDSTPCRGPLADLADVNVSHLNSATLSEWGEMWTANATPWASGIAPPPTDADGYPQKGYEIRLGGSEIIILSEQGQMGFLEFKGAGLDRIAETLARKEKNMAALGTRLLADDPRQAVAAETARIQRAGENSTLGGISRAVSRGLTAVIQEVALWLGLPNPQAIRFTLNDNFTPSGIGSDELNALVGAYQKGAISSRELFATLQSREVIDAQKTFEEHAEEIEQDSARIGAADLQITTPSEGDEDG
jgi:hypothetical protein